MEPSLPCRSVKEPIDKQPSDPRKGKGDKHKLLAPHETRKISLRVPLSQVSNHLVHVQVRDMECWVHRPTPIRHQEADKKGKVGRPMNQFMLYRAAYTERARGWLGRDDHKLMSIVVGQSWKIESQEVKDKYRELANIEKKNHMKAHPRYRYLPRKRFMEGKCYPNNKPDYKVDSTIATVQTPRTISTTQAMPIEEESGTYSSSLCFMEHRIISRNSLPGQTTDPSMLALEQKPIAYEPFYYPPQPFRASDAQASSNQAGYQGAQYGPPMAIFGFPEVGYHGLYQPPTSIATLRDDDEPWPGSHAQKLQHSVSNNNDGSISYTNLHFPMWSEAPMDGTDDTVQLSLSPSPEACKVDTNLISGMQRQVIPKDRF